MQKNFKILAESMSGQGYQHGFPLIAVFHSAELKIYESSVAWLINETEG